jgi:hypothetical protein
MPSWHGQGQLYHFLPFMFKATGDMAVSTLASRVGGIHFDSSTGNWLS